MMVNDVVNHEKNPFKGKLFNSPDGPDVYSDLQIDYSGAQVSATNFLKILRGNSTNSTHKVLNSSPNDSVLIYISSYGASGLIGFPSDVLTSASLNQALTGLNNDSKYGQMMIILDTDHSASMFDSVLPDNVNIFSVTSTSTDQQNYACFCNKPEFPYTCLGTSYSVAWLANTGSKESLMDETLDQQFDSIIQALDEALPQTPINPNKFGSKIFDDLRAGQFMGLEKSVKTENPTVIEDQLANFAVPFEMAGLESLDTHNDEPFNELKNARNSIDRAFYRLTSDMCAVGYCSDPQSIIQNNQAVKITDHQLYSQMVTKFHSDCLNLGENPYLLSKMYIFANILSESQAQIADNFSKFSSSLYQACRRRIIGHGYHHVV
ncbi:legumain [Tetranychus urticae]|nr:legumain [Tetranychus urticae]XP_015795953.1 legumain [Tetranychus urticae]